MSSATTKSLIGTPGQERSALARTVTGDTSHKKQRIHTPACVLEPLHRFWPGGIALDPCGSPGGLVRADRVLLIENGDDGLSEAWPDRTFINPPYRDLKKWLAHGLAGDCPGEQVWLIPVRPHREWWRHFEYDCDALVWLNPLAFDGYDQKFPAPLCLAYRGCDTDRFYDCFEHLGGRRL